MRRLATVVVTVTALLVPATAVRADPPQPGVPPPPPPIVVATLWPVCGTVLGVWICVPP